MKKKVWAEAMMSNGNDKNTVRYIFYSICVDGSRISQE